MFGAHAIASIGIFLIGNSCPGFVSRYYGRAHFNEAVTSFVPANQKPGINLTFAVPFGFPVFFLGLAGTSNFSQSRKFLRTAHHCSHYSLRNVPILCQRRH